MQPHGSSRPQSPPAGNDPTGPGNYQPLNCAPALATRPLSSHNIVSMMIDLFPFCKEFVESVSIYIVSYWSLSY